MTPTPPARAEERGRTWNADRPGPRRFQAFYVGLPKTGSTTVAEVFRHARSGHEYRFEAMAEHLAAGRDRGALRALLRERDAEGRLELDAATFHHFYLPELVDLFPEARFLCAVRPPRPWLDSILQMMVRNRRRYGDAPIPAWQLRLGRFMFGAYDPDAFRSEATLRAALPTLVPAWLGFWSEHTRATLGVLAGLPPERRLVLRTDALSGALPRLAAFVGVDPGSLDASAHHQNRAPERAPILDAMDAEALAAAVDAARAGLDPELCGDRQIP